MTSPASPAPPTPPIASVYTATFTFAKRQFDEAFHTLDQQIATLARSLPGYLGEEAWENSSTGQYSNVYYWSSLQALQALVQHPSHQQAKAGQAQWLDGYQVVIAQVLRHYGDARLPHVLAGAAPSAAHG